MKLEINQGYTTMHGQPVIKIAWANRLRLFSSQPVSRINTPTFWNLAILQNYPPMKVEQTEGSETSAYKIQMPGNYPEENIQQGWQRRQFFVNELIIN